MKYILLLIAFLSLSQISDAADVNNSRIAVDLSVKKVLDMPSAPDNSEDSEDNYYYKISQTLEKTSQVKVTIQSKEGKDIKVLFDGKADAGELHVAWDCDDKNGELVSSGEYVCVVKVDDKVKEEKINLK